MSDDEAKASAEGDNDGAKSANDDEVKSDYPLMGIKQPGPHDVLCGRGGGTNNHEGNVNFRQLVNEHKLRYLAASKVDKPKVAREVVKTWRGLDPPGRFLSRSEGSAVGPGSVKAEGNIWHDVGDKKAREKASQCLRERTPDVIPFVKELQRQQDFLTDHGLRYVEEQMKKGAIPGSGLGPIIPPPPAGVPPPPGPDGSPVDGFDKGTDSAYFGTNTGDQIPDQTQQQQPLNDVDNAFDPEHHAQHGQFLNIVNTTTSGVAFPPFEPGPSQSSIHDENGAGGHMGAPLSYHGHYQHSSPHPVNSMPPLPDQGQPNAAGWGFQNVQVVKRCEASHIGNNPSMPPPNAHPCGQMTVLPPSEFKSTTTFTQFGNSMVPDFGSARPDELTLEEYHQSLEEYMTRNRLPDEGSAAAAQECDAIESLNDDHSRRKEMGEMRENSWVKSFHSIETNSVSMMSAANSLKDDAGDSARSGLDGDDGANDRKQGQVDRNAPGRLSDSTIQASNLEVGVGHHKPNHVLSSNVEPRRGSTLSAFIQHPERFKRVDSMSRSQKLRFSSVPSQGVSTVSGMSMYSEGQQSSRSQKMATAHDLNSNISMMSELTDLSENLIQMDLAANNAS